MSDRQLTIEVAYALPSKQALLSLTVEPGCTVEQAIEASGIIRKFPEIDLSVNKVGIWNRTCKLTEQLNSGDRVEIYRPLLADPKEIRRRRAEKAKDEGRANKTTGAKI